MPKPKKRQMDIDDDSAEEKEDEKEDESCEDPSEKDLIDLTSQKAKKTLDEEVCLVSFSMVRAGRMRWLTGQVPRRMADSESDAIY